LSLSLSSSVLKTLRCYNNYHSHVLCSWEENMPTSSQASLALYYLDTQERIRLPVNLSEQAVEGGGRLLTWSSPYPQSSSLTSTLIYQVNYRSYRQDDWTVVETNDTQLKVEAGALGPGTKHEARVRAKGKIGLWSAWSPLVTWLTEDRGRFVECALDNDTVVTCTWEVNRTLAQIITFKLYCKDNQACCTNPNVRASSGDLVLVYSCTFSVRDLEHLEVKLIPTRDNSKVFKLHKNSESLFLRCWADLGRNRGTRSVLSVGPNYCLWCKYVHLQPTEPGDQGPCQTQLYLVRLACLLSHVKHHCPTLIPDPDIILNPNPKMTQHYTQYINTILTLLCHSSSDDPLWSLQDENGRFCSINREGSFLSSSSKLLSMGSPSVTDTSGLSFSGPYIFCGDTTPTSISTLRLQSPSEASDNTLSNNCPAVAMSPAPPVLVSCDDYVVMPQVTRSMEDLSGGLTSDNDPSDSNHRSGSEGHKSELFLPATAPSPTHSYPLPSENEDPPPEYTPPITGPFTMPSLDGYYFSAKLTISVPTTFIKINFYITFLLLWTLFFW
uniref:Fibronectin type-III domain-containing protein n=1 Tax=Esox lucius TaxID=8010 RepID=A0A3P8Y0U2_ESOLU